MTGAGGSVGSELARQLASCAPASLTLVDHAEYNLFRVEHQLRVEYPSLAIHAVLGDVSRRADIHSACLRPVRTPSITQRPTNTCRSLRVSVVAAARTNVLGTAETIRAARDVGARLLLVSSDKAADPRSVMGATKRLAELVAVYQRSRCSDRSSCDSATSLAAAAASSRSWRTRSRRPQRAGDRSGRDAFLHDR